MSPPSQPENATSKTRGSPGRCQREPSHSLMVSSLRPQMRTGRTRVTMAPLSARSFAPVPYSLGRPDSASGCARPLSGLFRPLPSREAERKGLGVPPKPPPKRAAPSLDSPAGWELSPRLGVGVQHLRNCALTPKTTCHNSSYLKAPVEHSARPPLRARRHLMPATYERLRFRIAHGECVEPFCRATVVS